MTDAPRAQLTVQLDPASSRRLFAALEYRRKARGWSRRKLAAKAGMEQDVLHTWAYKVRNGMPIRIDLDKALILLARVGVASNRVDDLTDQFAGEVSGLIDDAMEPS